MTDRLLCEMNSGISVTARGVPQVVKCRRPGTWRAVTYSGIVMCDACWGRWQVRNRPIESVQPL